MIEVTPATIMEFTKLLIECGNIYEVQPDYTIKNRLNGEQVQISNGKGVKPLCIYHEGATVNPNVAWLNPFKETLGVSREREWFFGLITTLPGMMIRIITEKLIEDAVKRVDDDCSNFALLSKIIDKVDQTMIMEVNKINASSYLSVFYNKREKVAEAQTELFGKELREAFPKFRKKTWEVIEIIFTEIFGSTDLEQYRYRSKLINIPETEAKLAVSVSLITAIGPWARDVLGKDLHEQELNQHMEVLEGYSRLYAYAAVAQDTSSKYAPPAAAPRAPAPMPGLVPMGVPNTGTYGQPNSAPISTIGGSIPISQYGGMGVPVTAELYGQTGFATPNGMMAAGDAATGLFGVPLS